MSLYAKIFMATMLPLMMFFLVGVIQIQNVIQKYESALKHNYELKAQGVQENISQVLAQMKTAASVLSESKEISKALQKADNNVLFDISKRFINPINSIIFADTLGTVISRAPDEYRFGDNVSAECYFKYTMEEQFFLGLAALDKIKSIVMAKPIKKYDDIAVGLVCVSISITRDLLKSFSDDKNIVVEFIINGQNYLSSSSQNRKIIHTEPLENIIENTHDTVKIHVHFGEDQYFSGLLNIRKSLYLTSIPSLLILLIMLTLILNRQLKPYSMIVGLILNYSNHKIKTDELKNRLMDVRKMSANGAFRISNALIQMLDVIENHFKKTEEYNLRLSQANQKLEKSLNEVKKLSGLLPICSHCKKIRDDKGYWNQIEEYIQKHSEAQFSHGICKECAKKHYPDLDLYKD